MRRIALAALVAMPGVANAQALACQIPSEIPVPHADTPTREQPRRLVPIVRYTLALTWSPQICRDFTEARAQGIFQCQRDNRFGFVLHGLWPDGAGGAWPQYCRPVSLLSPQTIRANLCATPSAQLLQHEWAKHGSCMPVNADRYFDRARGLFTALHFPDMNALSRREVLTAGSFAAALAKANRGMTAEMMRISATREGWLEEVWLCLDRQFRPASCPAGQGGKPVSTPIKIWRGN